MPVVTIERPRTLCPAGLAEFVLADVTPKMMPAFDGNGEVERWVWRFVSNKIDPETGQFFEVAIFTGKTYGDSRAKATWLLDLMIPGITKAQADQLNTDTLIGTHYEGSVKHEQAIRDPEKKIATFAYLKPLKGEGIADDPFEDDAFGSVVTCEWDGCGKELSPKEIAASKKHFGEAMAFCSAHGKLALQNKTPAATAA